MKHDAQSADSLMRENAELRALLAQLRSALDQIDRHVVGACEAGDGGMPEPCEECGEMREIAHQALQALKESEA